MKKDTYALVTGASSGMGYEFARQLAAKGYNLLIVSNEEAIHEKARILKNDFPDRDVVSLVRNLGVEEAANELYAYAHAHDLNIEVLVNNAGVYHDRDILDDSEGFTKLILLLHVYTPAMLCYYFGQDMKTKRKGYILNVCSVTSKIAVQRLGTYSSTKAFLNNFTRSLHIELHQHGVYVTNVSPGAVDTGLYNISDIYTRVGKCIGLIVSPETLVRRGLRAMFRGRYKVTVPAVWWHMITSVVQLLSARMMRLIRWLKLF